MQMNEDDTETEQLNENETGTEGITETEETHVLYYRNQFSPYYSTAERTINQIVQNNVNCVHPGHKLKLIIYYKSATNSSLFMKNAQSPPVDDLQKINLVCGYRCSLGDCEHLNNSYIVITRTILSRRLTMYKSNGVPKDHLNNHHGAHLTRDHLLSNTNVRRRENDQYRLMIFEALFIYSKIP